MDAYSVARRVSNLVARSNVVRECYAVTERTIVPLRCLPPSAPVDLWCSVDSNNGVHTVRTRDAAGTTAVVYLVDGKVVGDVRTHASTSPPPKCIDIPCETDDEAIPPIFFGR